MKMRNKRVKQQDLLYRSPGRTLPAAGKKNTFLTQAPEPAPVVVPVFNKQQNRVVQNVLAHADQDTAEDLAIAMSLLGRYQKDKNFIKKEFLETKRKGELLNIAEEEVKQIKKENHKSTIDLNLTQAERHRNVEDKRKQRIERQSSNQRQLQYQQKSPSKHKDYSKKQTKQNGDLLVVMPETSKQRQPRQANLKVDKPQEDSSFQEDYAKVQQEIQEYKQTVIQQ